MNDSTHPELRAALADCGELELLGRDPLHKWETLTSLVTGTTDLATCHRRPTSDSDSQEDTDTATESGEEEEDTEKGIETAIRIEADSDKGNEAVPAGPSLQRSQSSRTVCPDPAVAGGRAATLPCRLSQLRDSTDLLLAVEREYREEERLYHTVAGSLPLDQNCNDQNINQTEKDNIINNNTSNTEAVTTDNRAAKKTKPDSITTERKRFTVERLAEPPEEPAQPRRPGRGPRALRRRGRMDKARLRRRSSVNGHWYDRDTSVFKPPLHAPMCVFASSQQRAGPVLAALLEKYKIEAEPGQYALYVVRETGETRLVGEQECPLLLRVRLGPHEEVAKLYLMDRRTEEVSHAVAQFIRWVHIFSTFTLTVQTMLSDFPTLNCEHSSTCSTRRRSARRT